MALMTEESYIIATNLGKVTAARQAVQDCLFMNTEGEATKSQLMKMLGDLEDKLRDEITIGTPTAPARK